jgi:hypothetical protein
VASFSFYDWEGRQVGINTVRLVSDSEVRKIYFHDNGKLYIVGWSDGGNSVFNYEPVNLRKPVPFEGLGFRPYGAGVMSFSHLVKIDVDTAKVEGKTTWCGFIPWNIHWEKRLAERFHSIRDRPNTVVVNEISVAPDNSVLLGGASAFGLIQTGNNINGGAAPGGNYIAIMTPDFGSLRFCSIMPSCGGAQIRKGTAWGIASATVKGRNYAIYVGSCGEPSGCYCRCPHPAPTIKPIQKAFSGGLTDGYLVLFDLGAAEGEAKER